MVAFMHHLPRFFGRSLLKNPVSRAMIWCWIVSVLLVPSLLVALYTIDLGFGLIFLFVHQLYYMPLASWIGEPFFLSDSDVMFWVTWPGRFLTAILYTCLIVLAKLVFELVKNKRNLS